MQKYNKTMAEILAEEEREREGEFLPTLPILLASPLLFRSLSSLNVPVHPRWRYIYILCLYVFEIFCKLKTLALYAHTFFEKCEVSQTSQTQIHFFISVCSRAPAHNRI